jgi:hypothetical protein
MLASASFTQTELDRKLESWLTNLGWNSQHAEAGWLAGSICSDNLKQSFSGTTI